MNRDNRPPDKRTLLMDITRISFVLDELRLYLDTHNDDKQALALYQQYQTQRHQLVGEYTKNYGSLTAYYVNTDNGWNWATAPMPWQGGL